MRLPFLLAVLAAGCLRAEDPKPASPMRMPLWSESVPDGAGGVDPDGKPSITVHRAAAGDGTAVVICPGGGYGGLVTGAEGHGIAEWLNRHGITGVVLEYRMPRGRAEVPLLDARRALRQVRHHAAEWGVKPDRVGILGFSAGGHLAATAATLSEPGLPEAKDPVDRQDGRPDFAVLVYPVVTMGPGGHGGSRENLLGRNPSAALEERFSAELQVTAKTPPMFLAHAVDDRAVPVSNSRSLAAALEAKGIPHVLLELPDGDHGLNGYRGASWDRWQREGLDWIRGRRGTAK